MKRLTAFLSHDIDVPFKYNLIGSLVEAKKGVKEATGAKFRGSAKTFSGLVAGIVLGKNPYWQFEKIIELEKSYGFKSTFFFCVKRRHKLDPYYSIKNKKIIGIIKRLDREGFEIGLHGSYLSYKNLSYLMEEKRILEGVLGKKVMGIRQHFLNFNDNTTKLQKEAGFSYDSSFGFADNIGFKENKTAPFKTHGLLEIPLVVMDGSIGKMRLDERQAWLKVKSLIDTASSKGHFISFNWHERYVGEDFLMFEKLYKKILSYLKEIDAEVLTGRQIYEKWQK